MYGMNYGQMGGACCPRPICCPPIAPVAPVRAGVGVAVIAVAILILIALGLIF